MDPSAFALVQRRLSEGSRPGARRKGDRAHLALAVEGGGMRGCVSAGMLVALEQFDALPAFDSVWGASAGALNASYFLSGQATLSAHIYPDHLTGNRFINPRRFMRGGDFISLDYLFSLLRGPAATYALDVKAVLESPISFHPVSFCLDDWAIEDLGHPKDEEELFLHLRASAQVPLFAGKPIEVGGKRFFDAACGEFIPVQSALKAGATHVLALHTRPRGLCPPHVSRIERLMYRRWLAPIDTRLIDYFERRQQLYLAQMAAISQLGVHVTSVYPAGVGEPVSATERKREPVLHAFQLGVNAVLDAWPAEEEVTATGWRERLGQLPTRLRLAFARA